MFTIIGRKKEIAELNRYYRSNKSEFIAVYGRRRVGKTFLIDEIFRDNMIFHHTGLSPYDKKRRVSTKDQLQNFYFSLIRHGMDGAVLPKTWMEAFFLLEQFLKSRDNGERQVVFIDELPWMDTARSGFLTALEAFWNGWGNMQHNLCFIVCGSATSWMLDNLINNKGGLYGRLTGEIKLSPFTLRECEEFFLSRGIKMSRYQTIQAYMVVGGIPFYLNLFNPAFSLAQNIDNLFFDQSAKLGDEFERLFNSVFDNADKCMAIVRVLSRRHSGYSRDELAQKVQTAPNGDFTKMMKALIGSGFVVKYVPFGNKQNENLYKLIDPFCWFWLHFKEKLKVSKTDYWQHYQKEAEIISWRGIAFEEVCFQHIYQIKFALQIAGVSSTESAYIVRGDDKNEGLQIDLLISRDDNVVNLCEMKYCKEPFEVSHSYADTLERRLVQMERAFPNKAFHLTYIGSRELHHNSYSDIFVSELSSDQLFV